MAPCSTTALFAVGHQASSPLLSSQRGVIISMHAHASLPVYFDIKKISVIGAFVRIGAGLVNATRGSSRWGARRNTAAADRLGVAQVSTFWQRAMLWIWLVSQVIMFAPKFEVGALAEQVTGIWCVPCNAISYCGAFRVRLEQDMQTGLGLGTSVCMRWWGQSGCWCTTAPILLL